MSESDFAKKINKSKSYMLPLLEGSIDIQYIRLILNTYLHLKPDPVFDYRTIHILYDKALDKQELFEEYIEEVKRCFLFINFKEVSNGYLLSLRIPEQHIIDYDRFTEGKYSELADASKKKILYHLYKHYPELNNILKEIEYILYKNDKLRKAWENKLDTSISEKAELSSITNPVDETYDLSINS